MAIRNIRRPRKAVTTEDAFGTPPAARGSMNVVAGEEDDLQPGEELLVDDGEDLGETDAMDTMDGPVYEGRIVRIKLGVLRRLLANKLGR